MSGNVTPEAEQAIRVLLIDDDPVQHFLLRGLLDDIKETRFELVCATTLAEGGQLLESSKVDVLVLDLGLPDCSVTDGFSRIQGGFPQLPVVVFTAMEDESLGTQLVKAGAQDYLVKGQITAPLLGRTLRYAIERKRLTIELLQTMAEVKTLSGLLPICAKCKKIRDDKGYWTRIEKYIQQHTDAEFSHGICPDCMKELYAEFDVDASAGNVK